MAPVSRGPSTISFSLRGAGGEPVDFRRAATSHGLTNVAPFASDGSTLRTVVRLPDGEPRAVRLRERSGRCLASVAGERLARRESTALRETLRRVLALDEDLSSFYELLADEPTLSWARLGAGRIVRSQTVFEDTIRTLCTTNCSFSATRRMITTTVEELGDVAPPGAPAPGSRAFPTPESVATAGVAFFRERARAGYRSEHIVSIAQQVAGGELDLESLRAGAPGAPSDEEARARLLALPGIGPYAAAHSLMLMGRYSHLVLDSWTRPAYARATGRRATDRAIRNRFARFGPYAGLAFWLVVTKSWIA